MAWVLGRGGPLAGRHVVVAAVRREPLDPVRYLSNHSSGRMGYAVAIAARDLGADVTLISGPVALAAPLGMRIEPVETAAEMLSAVLKCLQADPSFDALVMTAAVADYRQLVVSDRKLKKAHAFGGTTGSMPDLSFTLELAQNQDILAEVNRIVLPWPAERSPIRVGFAAETEDLVSNARLKLEAKGLDLVVANPVPQAFGAVEADITLIDHHGVSPLGPMAKEAAADRIWAEVLDARSIDRDQSAPLAVRHRSGVIQRRP